MEEPSYSTSNLKISADDARMVLAERLAKCSLLFSSIPTCWLFVRGAINKPISSDDPYSNFLFVDLAIVVLLPLGALILGGLATRSIKASGKHSAYRKFMWIGMGFSAYYILTFLIALLSSVF